MLVPHLHFNGQCLEAIRFYEHAFSAPCDTLILHSEADPEKGVVHAEMRIHGQRIMLNDQPETPVMTPDSMIHLVIVFEEAESLRETFERIRPGCQLLYPMQAVDYSPCIVGFLDRFGVRWGFMAA